MIDIAVMEANRGWENQTWDLNGKLMKTDGGTVEKNVAFKVGWAEMGLEGMKNKTKPNKSGSKGKQKIRPICGPVVSKNKNANNGEMGLSEDTWRRVVSPCNHASPSLDVEIGLKRKSTSLNSEIAEVITQEKKKKMDTEDVCAKTAEVDVASEPLISGNGRNMQRMEQMGRGNLLDPLPNNSLLSVSPRWL
nr:hypothetical protein CFP56_77508 [Quercus suber]